MLDTTRFRLKGHTLMVVASNMNEAMTWLLLKQYSQFQVHTDSNGEVRIGIPLAVEERESYAWLYHRMKGLEKSEPPKGGPKPPKGPTPPTTGGTPAAGQVAAVTEVNAVAA